MVEGSIVGAGWKKIMENNEIACSFILDWASNKSVILNSSVYRAPQNIQGHGKISLIYIFESPVCTDTGEYQQLN